MFDSNANFVGVIRFKGDAQFVKNTTLRKNDGSTLKNVLQNTYERTCDYLYYFANLFTLKRCLRDD